MKYLLVPLLLLLVGCQMSNDEIIRESRKCLDAGMGVVAARMFGDGYTIGIECVPPGEPSR